MNDIKSVVLDIDTKIVVNSKCDHPNKRNAIKEYLSDNLPIPEFAWTHCVFCHNNDCIFGGECKYKIKVDF